MEKFGASNTFIQPYAPRPPPPFNLFLTSLFWRSSFKFIVSSFYHWKVDRFPLFYLDIGFPVQYFLYLSPHLQNNSLPILLLFLSAVASLPVGNLPSPQAQTPSTGVLQAMLKIASPQATATQMEIS